MLAALAAPSPVAAQSAGQLFCLHNDLLLYQLRVKIRQYQPNGQRNDPNWIRVPPKSQECIRLQSPHAVGFELEMWDLDGGWQRATGNCNVTLINPAGGAILRAYRPPGIGWLCAVQ